ncbi:MAG: hypothetical protein WDM89_04250 [Rhizomicrobium sp.]
MFKAWVLLLMGWLGVLAFMPAWFANVWILAVGVLLVLKKRPPVWLGVLAPIFAASAWWWTNWYDDTGNVPICHYHAGYWVWLGAALASLAVTLIVRMRTTSA